MPNPSPQKQMIKSLRDRFARFLGESDGQSIRKFRPGVIPLWEFEPHNRHSISNGRGPRPSSHHLRRQIQVAIHEVLRRLHGSCWGSYIVGGTLRDLIANIPGRHSALLPRDIDIVVLGLSLSELENRFSDLIQRHTRFGGLHLVTDIANVCQVHFDVWPLAETWAFKQYSFQPEISQFPLTPFMNLDAIAVEVFPRPGHGRAVYEHGFFRGIADRQIDINFEPNPFPDVCVIRALIMAAKLQFAISRSLAAFICSRAEQTGFAEILQNAQLSHYGQVRCGSAELMDWLGSIKKQLEQGVGRIEVRVSSSRQEELRLDYPPSLIQNLSAADEFEPSPSTQTDIVRHARS